MYLGVDVGGTSTKLGIVDGGGRLVSESSFHTTCYQSADHFLNALEGEITRMISLLDQQIAGIGLGAPSANFRTGIIENAANLGWKGKFNIQEELQQRIGCEVMVTNDANLPALGEMNFGAARGMENFITISLGTGLGSGIVCNGELVGGHHGMAGELGHTMAEADGRLCGCGKKGCLETYVSATGIKRTVFDLLSSHNGGVSELTQITFSELTAEQITEAAIAGDPMAIKAFEITGDILGRHLADLACITDPEAIFLVGGMAQAGDLLFKPTRRSLQDHQMKSFRSELEVRGSALPPDKISLLGACGLIAGKRSPNNISNTIGLL